MIDPYIETEIDFSTIVALGILGFDEISLKIGNYFINRNSSGFNVARLFQRLIIDTVGMERFNQVNR